MKPLRKLRNLLFSLLALLLILLATLSALVETDAGSRWLVKSIAGVMQAELGAVAGNLRRGLDLEFVDYQQGETRVRIEQLSFRWRPVDLLYSALAIESLSAQKVLLQLPPAAAAASADQPFSHWPDLGLPLRIQLRQFALHNIEFRQGEQRQHWQKLSGSLGLGTFHLRYNQLALLHEDYSLHLSGQSDLEFPYHTEASLQWQWHPPAAAVTDAVDAVDAPAAAEALVYMGVSELRGSLLKLQLDSRLSAPLVAELTLGGALVNAQRELDLAPQLQAQLRWQNQQLPAAWWLAQHSAPLTSVELNAQGNWHQYQAQLSGSVQLTDAPALAVEASASGDLEQIHFDRLQISEAGATADLDAVAAQLNLSGALRWLPQLQWQLAAQAQRFNLASLIDNWPSNLNASFTSSGSLRAGQWQADLRQLQLAGDLRGVNLQGAGELVFNNGQLHSDQLELVVGANQLQLQGSLGEQLDLHWNINAPMLQQIDGSLSGSLISKGELQGSRQLPRINISASAEKFAWGDYALDKLSLALQPLRPQASPAAPVAALTSHVPPAASQVKLLGQLSEELLREDYQLRFNSSQLRLPGQRFTSIVIKGDGALARHQVDAVIKSASLGRLDFNLSGAYSNQQWQGQLQQLALKLKKVPRWWLTASKPIRIGSGYVELQSQCLTTRTNLTGVVERDSAIEREQVRSEWQPNQSRAAAQYPELMAAKPLPSSPVEKYTLPQLCLQGDWNSSGGARLQAQLDSVPLRQFLSLFKTEVYFAGVMDGAVTLSSPDFSLARTQASASVTTRNAELRYQYAGGGTEVYPWRDFALRAQLENSQLQASAGMEWVGFGRLDATSQLDLQRQTISSARLQAQFDNIAPLETLLPFANDVKGELRADLSAGGSFSAPYLLGQVSLRQGSANLPRLGLDVTHIELQLDSTRAGTLNWVSQLQSGDGRLSIVGDLTGFGSPQWAAQGAINGSDIKVINLPELKATLSPNLTIAARSGALNISGEALIPWARANIKSLPPSATQVSGDVVIVDEQYQQEPPAPPIHVYSNVSLALGEDVRFKGFGLSSKLNGKLNLLKESQRQFFTNGYVSVAEGSYKAYGQTLTIDRGRLAFQGPYEDPGLDIRASRIIRGDEEIKVGLNIGGTLQRPKATVFSSPGSKSDSDAMMMLLTGKPVKDASKADASLLVSAMSGLGMDSGGSISAEINRFFGVDELEVKSDEGIDQSQLWIGKYLTPKLLVRYVVGIFDQAFSFGMEYQITNNLRIEAESGETKSVDVIYKIER